MNINANMIRYAITISKKRNVSEAAKELGLTQGALTALVTRLPLSTNGEKVFEIKRGNAHESVSVTPYGKKWLFQAQNTLRSIESLEKISGKVNG